MLTQTRKTAKNKIKTPGSYSGKTGFAAPSEGRKQTTATNTGNQQRLSNKFGITENDVVLAAIPVSHEDWLELTEVCISTGAELILPEANADINALADTVVNKNVTVVAATSEVWRTIYDDVNANPGEVSHLRAIILDVTNKPAFRHSLILNALSKAKIDDVFAAYQLAPWIKNQNSK